MSETSHLLRPTESVASYQRNRKTKDKSKRRSSAAPSSPSAPSDGPPHEVERYFREHMRDYQPTSTDAFLKKYQKTLAERQRQIDYARVSDSSGSFQTYGGNVNAYKSQMGQDLEDEDAISSIIRDYRQHVQPVLGQNSGNGAMEYSELDSSPRKRSPQKMPQRDRSKSPSLPSKPLGFGRATSPVSEPATKFYAPTESLLQRYRDNVAGTELSSRFVRDMYEGGLPEPRYYPEYDLHKPTHGGTTSENMNSNGNAKASDADLMYENGDNSNFKKEPFHSPLHKTSAEARLYNIMDKPDAIPVRTFKNSKIPKAPANFKLPDGEHGN